MTTYVAARDALVAKINAALAADYPTLPLFYENTTMVDTNSVGDNFLYINIDFVTAKQVTMELDPKHRVLGEVSFRFMYKEGKGTRTSLAMFDYLTTLMKHQGVGGVSTKTPKPGKKMSLDGWASFDLHVPFQFDSIP